MGAKWKQRCFKLMRYIEERQPRMRASQPQAIHPWNALFAHQTNSLSHAIDSSLLCFSFCFVFHRSVYRIYIPYSVHKCVYSVSIHAHSLTHSFSFSRLCAMMAPPINYSTFMLLRRFTRNGQTHIQAYTCTHKYTCQAYIHAVYMHERFVFHSYIRIHADNAYVLVQYCGLWIVDWRCSAYTLWCVEIWK